MMTKVMGAFNARLVATMTAANPSVSVRSFVAAKKKKAKKEDGTVTQDEGSGSDTPVTVYSEPAIVNKAVTSGEIPAWKRVTTTLNLDQSLFAPFDMGSINKVKSTPDNKAPS